MIAIVNNEVLELRILSFTNTANGRKYVLDGNSDSIWIEKDRPTKFMPLTQFQVANSKAYVITKVALNDVSYSTGDKVLLKNGVEKEIFGFHYNNGVKINGIEWGELSVFNDSNILTNDMTLKKSEPITTSIDGPSLLDFAIKNVPIKSEEDDLELLKIPLNSSFLAKGKNNNNGVIYEFLLSNITKRGYLHVVKKEEGVGFWISSDDFLKSYEVIDICPKQ